MITRILLIFFIAVSFVSCSSSGKVTKDTNSDMLIFGSGGGFTGIYKSLEIHRDGRVFNISPDNSQNMVKRISKKQAREIFVQAGKLKVNQPAFSQPGNMTWFIKFKFEGDSGEYKWGDSNFSVPDEIKDFYNHLNTIVK